MSDGPTGDRRTVRARRAMILAAGLGSRLRPVTDHVAKPLLPVAGKPLLGIIADNLIRAGVREIAVNTHHLAEQVASYIEAYGSAPGVPASRITVFHEPRILGTGGALWNAREFLARDECFILHNGDVLSDLDLAELVAEHLGSGALATLALVDWAPINTVLLGPDGAVRDVGGRLAARAGSACRSMTYTGIAVVSRSLLELLPPGPSSLVDALIDALKERAGAVRGMPLGRHYWNDLGTVAKYLDAHADLLLHRKLSLAGLRVPASAIFTAEGARISPDASLGGFVAAGRRCVIESGARLADSVLLDGAVVGPDRTLRRAVVGPGWSVTEAQNEVAGLAVVVDTIWAANDEAERLTGHGSDRRFWRLRRGDDSAILMSTNRQDVEFERYCAIGRFLHEQDLGGPEILAVAEEEHAVLMEDLGSDSVCRLMHAAVRQPGRDRDASFDLACRVLDRLVDLQTSGTTRLDLCPLAGDRVFDYETLRWETDYFRRRFLVEHVGWPIDELAVLDDEFHALAEAVLVQPVVFMHRDFQSQNVFIKEGVVRLVDFQGARRGPLAYDLMSFLRDAYMDLDREWRAELLEYYRNCLAAAGGPDLAAAEIGAMAVTAGLQRNMQALGAFAFLSHEKGKREFLAHMPRGLRHLREGLHELRAMKAAPGPLPALETVVEAIAKTPDRVSDRDS